MSKTAGRAQAALGFRVHSGWAAAVVVAGEPLDPVVIVRTRFDLIGRLGASGDTREAKQPYHAAAEMAPADAARFIQRAIERTTGCARESLAELVGSVERGGHTLAGCGILLASGRPLPDLAATLASHALIHTAEGELFRNAVAGAARERNLPLTLVKERDLYAKASAALGVTAERLRERSGAMGLAVGPPWRQDEKLAAIVAWMALAGRE